MHELVAPKSHVSPFVVSHSNEFRQLFPILSFETYNLKWNIIFSIHLERTKSNNN